LIALSRRPQQLKPVLGVLLALLNFVLGAWYLLQKLLGLGLTPGLSATILAVSLFREFNCWP